MLSVRRSVAILAFSWVFSNGLALAQSQAQTPQINVDSMMAMGAMLDAMNPHLERLNQPLALLTEQLDWINEQNGSEAQQHKFAIAAGKVNELEDFGELVIFPSSRKTKIDQAMQDSVQQMRHVIVVLKEQNLSSPACLSQISDFETKLGQLSTKLSQFYALDVSQNTQRAEAYMLLTSALPLTMLSGQVQMLVLSCAMG